MISPPDQPQLMGFVQKVQKDVVLDFEEGTAVYVYIVEDRIQLAPSGTRCDN